MSLKALFRWCSAPGTRRGYVINLWRWKLAGQWKVGEDVIGNEYMLYQPFQETPIRRLCLFKRGSIGLDDMPFLWYQWIRYQRDFPPTLLELQEYDQYLIDIKQKARNIELLDQQLRKDEHLFIEEQQKRTKQDKQELTEKVQNDVIEMFQRREHALRIAAENKLKRMQDVNEAMKEDERQKYDNEKKKLEQIFNDPSSIEPKLHANVGEHIINIDGSTTPAVDGKDIGPKKKEEKFTPGAWRPWDEHQPDDDEEDEENAERSVA